MVTYVCDPNTWEVEAEGCWTWGQPLGHSKTFSKVNKREGRICSFRGRKCSRWTWDYGYIALVLLILFYKLSDVHRNIIGCTMNTHPLIHIWHKHNNFVITNEGKTISFRKILNLFVCPSRISLLWRHAQTYFQVFGPCTPNETA